MRAPENIKTPYQYIERLPEPRRAALRTIHEAIRKAAPELKPEMIGGLLGYGKYHYKYASGHEGDAGVIGLASQKHHISLYLGCTDDGLAAKNKDRLGKVSVGKCCIRFKKLEDLNLEVAMELVKQSAKSHAKSAAEK